MLPIGALLVVPGHGYVVRVENEYLDKAAVRELSFLGLRTEHTNTRKLRKSSEDFGVFPRHRQLENTPRNTNKPLNFYYYR